MLIESVILMEFYNLDLSKIVLVFRKILAAKKE